LHLNRDVLVPDLAGWRRERMPDFPDVAAFTVAPDWACEVVSPATERLDRARKMSVYARERVVHLWLVLATHEGTALVRGEPFEAIELELARLWGE
jgi:Uma2 family endonuclease